jgi:hypothetical protein
MSKITIHNKSKLNFNTKAGLIKSGSFIEIEEKAARNLLKSYPNQLQEAANSVEKDEEIKKLKAELKKVKKKTKANNPEETKESEEVKTETETETETE